MTAVARSGGARPGGRGVPTCARWSVDAVVADAWAVLRQGVAAVLGRCGVSAVQLVTTATEAVAAVAHGGVGLVVLGAVGDIGPDLALDRIRTAAGDDVRTIVLLDGGGRDDALRLLDAGAGAVLRRRASEHELAEAAVAVARGERYVDPALLDAGPAPPAPWVLGLTAREQAVLELLVEGRSNRSIAEALFIAEATVKSHLHNVYDKLGVGGRIEAIAALRERGLLPSTEGRPGR